MASSTVISERDLDQSWTVIGAGGFGQVFKTRHRRWGRDVAVKLLCPDNGTTPDRALLREVELMRRAESSYVMKVQGVFRGSRPSSPDVHLGLVMELLVMELMDNGSLASLQERLKHLPPWALVFRLAHQVALGMKHLHGLSPPIIHKDLKPGNVLLDKHLNVKITDFGLAKFVDNVTSTCVKGFGTTYFMPPEASACPFDVYSYAILLWSVLNTGHSHVPFDVSRGERPSLDIIRGLKASGLEELLELMKKSWHQDPSRRPRFLECSAVTEVVYARHSSGIDAALSQVLKELGKEDKPKPNPNPNPNPGNGGKIALAAVAGAAICGVGTVAAAPFVLAGIGFGSAGIAAGSWAAGWMSSAAIANGGGVAAGSLVPILQSAGAAGLSATAAAVVGGTGAAVGGAVGAAGAALVGGANDDDDATTGGGASGKNLHPGARLFLHV